MEVWLPGTNTATEIDTRHGEVCTLCPKLKGRQAPNPDDPSQTITITVCNDCGIDIPFYENMGRNGYQSLTVDHVHLKEMGITHPGRHVINKTLCKECYIKDRKIAYPNEPVRPL